MEKQETCFLVGTSGWMYPEWKGVFYPENLPQNRWFEHYASTFPTVEVNATFYRWFKDSTYCKWHERAPERFEYVLKAPKLITHRKYLLEAEEPIRSFMKSASLLGNKLGLILLQLAPNMPVDPERLNGALIAFGDPRKIAVEFRNPKWITEETHDLLKKLGAVFCSADSPKSELSDWVTSDMAYIRLHGRRAWYADEYTNRELEEIARMAKRMSTKGAQKVYIFFNNDFYGFAVKNAMALLRLLD